MNAWTPPPSIAAHYADVAEAAAKYGYTVRPSKGPLACWEMYNRAGLVAYGSLDELEQYLRRESKLAAMLTRVVRRR